MVCVRATCLQHLLYQILDRSLFLKHEMSLLALGKGKPEVRLPCPLPGSLVLRIYLQTPNSRILGFLFPHKSLVTGTWRQLFFYQKVHGGCSSSKVGILVTFTGIEMMAHGSPCCSRERRIM